MKLTVIFAAIDADPGNPRYAYFYALSFREKDFMKFRELLLKIAEDFPDHEVANNALVNLEFNTTNIKEKIEIYERITKGFLSAKQRERSVPSALWRYYDLLLAYSPEKAWALAQSVSGEVDKDDKNKKDWEGKVNTAYWGRVRTMDEAGSEKPEQDLNKAVAAFKKEMELFPELRRRYLADYIHVLAQVRKDEAMVEAQKEIEWLLKEGLKTENDYRLLEAIYHYAGLREQAKLITAIKKEKFPKGKWSIEAAYTAFMKQMAEAADPVQATQVAQDFIEKIKTTPEWGSQDGFINLAGETVLKKLVELKDWKGLKAHLSDYKADHFIYYSAANALLKEGAHPDFAEQLSLKLAEYAKKQLADPTIRNFKCNAIYCRYMDTYARALYQQGQYKKAFTLSGEVIKLDGMKQLAYVNTYAFAAAKALPARQYVKEMEQLVKDGHSTEQIIESLQKNYAVGKGNHQGFKEYISALQTESYRNFKEEVRKKMINQAAPDFTLLDLDGKAVKMNELKGKVVVVDFWATWCEPCKASMPGMQKLVNKYKDNPDVTFLFIDTWETRKGSTEQVVKFIADKKYPFHVLLDSESTVVAQFKVTGIPTKFIIDKAGTIRFKAIGFEGSDDNLVKHLSAMIEVSGEL